MLIASNNFLCVVLCLFTQMDLTESHFIVCSGFCCRCCEIADFRSCFLIEALCSSIRMLRGEWQEKRIPKQFTVLWYPNNFDFPMIYHTQETDDIQANLRYNYRPSQEIVDRKIKMFNHWYLCVGLSEIDGFWIKMELMSISLQSGVRKKV